MGHSTMKLLSNASFTENCLFVTQYDEPWNILIRISIDKQISAHCFALESLKRANRHFITVFEFLVYSFISNNTFMRQTKFCND